MPETYPPHLTHVVTVNGTLVSVTCVCHLSHDHDLDEMDEL